MTQLRPLRSGRRLVSSMIVAGLTVSGANAAFAQQVAEGVTREVATFFVRGVDSAFDPDTNTYLIVGGHGVVQGLCVNGSGVRISGPFMLNPAGSGHGAFPRARYSRQIAGTGGFLVTWAEEVGNPSEIHARTVTCSGTMGPERVISGGHNAWLESGAAIEYSPTSQRFLVAWKSFAPARIKAALVDNTGTLVSSVVDLSSGFARDPGVAWNPSTNEFGVSFSGESGDPNNPLNFSAFAVVPAANPAGFKRNTFNSFMGGMNAITDLAFNPSTGRYVMTWFELSSGALAKIAEFDAGGNLVSSGLASSRLGSYDALSIAYNPVSGTFLLGGIDRSNDATLGLELNRRGFPFNGENTLSATHRPSYYTRVASSSLSRTWRLTFTSRLFAGIGSAIATGFTSGGGPTGAHGAGGGAPPPPSSPPPPPTGCTTVQPGAGWTCVNGGWLPPSSPPPPPSGGCTTISPGPGWVCVNGGWLPPTSPTNSGSCSTPWPGTGWVCVNGGWLPPGSTGTPPPPPPTSSCSTVQPGAGWICVNGGWVPANSPLAPVTCPTVQPGPGWVCVNGGWRPPGTAPLPTTGGGGGGCVTPYPGAGWVCVNGGWLPPGSPLIPVTCSTVKPGAGWVCVNGGWLPPDTSPAQAAAGGCTGTAPVTGWLCIRGQWVPPNHPLATGGNAP